MLWIFGVSVLHGKYYSRYKIIQHSRFLPEYKFAKTKTKKYCPHFCTITSIYPILCLYITDFKHVLNPVDSNGFIYHYPTFHVTYNIFIWISTRKHEKFPLSKKTIIVLLITPITLSVQSNRLDSWWHYPFCYYEDWLDF